MASAVPSQAQLYDDIRQKGVTPERAAQLFSMVIGPLPGVSVAGAERDPNDYCGTVALGYLHQVWRALTDAQRAAARTLLSGSSTTRGPAGLASTLIGRLLPVTLFAAPAPTPKSDYQKLLEDADVKLGQYFASKPLPFVVNVEYGPPPGTTYAATWRWNFDTNEPWPDGCHITVWDQRFHGLTLSDAASVMTHEMFHCYQESWVEHALDMASIHRWIKEGEATWVMAVLYPNATVYVKDWKSYISRPDKIYSDREKDAVGVFGHVGDVGGSNDEVWNKLLPLIELGIGGNDIDPFNRLILGHEIPYYTSWGSSYFESTRDPTWRMSGPGPVPMTGAPPGAVTVAPGSEFHTAAAKYQAGLLEVNGQADVVVIGLLTGYGRVHDAYFDLETALDTSGPLALCLKSGGCRCPDGSPGASLIAQPATAPLDIGFDGGETTADLAIVGRSIDDFCKQKEKPSPPPPPLSGGSGAGGGGTDPSKPSPDSPPPGGESVGDPHLATFDGLHYDFQVVGEYTLVRSMKDDFIVQIRQVPALGSKTVALNQAVATRLGSDRVTISLENSAEVLRVNGKITSGPVPVLKSGTITRAMTMYGAAYQLTWPDGTVVRAEQLGRFGLNVKVQPAASRHGTLAGLLGGGDGSAANDRRSKNHADLADAWRVSAETSLFDYLPGQSTATFTDPTFPNADINAASVPNRAAAEKACRDQGITDAHLLDDCILDLAETNESLFGSAYGHAQQVLTARAALARTVVSTGPVAGNLPVLMMSGTITDKTQQPEFHFEAHKDDVIWVNQPDCSDSSQGQTIFMMLSDPTGKLIRAAPGCELGRFALAVGGTYTVKANNARNELGAYHVPIRFVRHDRRQAIAYNTAVSGTIETNAAHDVYTFSGKAGDVVQISGEGCEVPGFTGIVDPKGFDLLGPGCRSGTGARLTQTGTWELIINYTNSSTGPYHFVLQNVGKE